jgi:hypothetical protein
MTWICFVVFAACVIPKESSEMINAAELMERIETLEAHVAKLEGRKAEPRVKPVLEIQLAKYGSPQSEALVDDIKRLSDMNHPVEFRYVTFTAGSPAFRWYDNDGIAKIKYGYKTRTLHKIIETVTGKPYEVDYDGPVFGGG